MKKALIFSAAFLIIAAPAIVLAQTATGPLVPGASSASQLPTAYNFCTLRDLANSIISYAIYLSVFVATLMFAYGGILYVTGAANEGNIKKAHSVFSKTFIGLVIVLIAWLIVNIVLSVLTGGGVANWTGWFSSGGAGCNQITSSAFNPTTSTNTGGITTGTPTGPLATGTLSNNDALTQLHNAGVCGDQYSCLKAGASLQGIRQSTVDELIQLHDACGCQFTVTSGTDGSHAGGDYSHANGYKVDIRTSDNAMLTSWVQQNFNGPTSVIWGGVSSQQYTDGCGNKYTNEGDHWDVGYINSCTYSGG